MPIDAMLQAGPIKQRKRRSSRLAVSTFNRFKQKEKGLSTGEKKMLNNAKQILVSELVLTEHATQDEIEQMVDSKISTSYEEYKVDSNISASDISSDIVSKFIPFNSDDINKKASND